MNLNLIFVIKKTKYIVLRKIEIIKYTINNKKYSI